jgi:hypothetical protein
VYDPRSPWWVFERLQRIVAQSPDLATAARRELRGLEARFQTQACAAETEAERLLAGGDRPAALGVLRRLVETSSVEAIDLARRLGDELEPHAGRVAVPSMVEAWCQLNESVGLASPAPAGPVALAHAQSSAHPLPRQTSR